MIAERSVVVHAGVQLVSPLALVVAVWLFFAGHNQPGGGFIAGLVGGTALVLQFITGRPGVHAPLPLRPEMMMGLGILFAGGMGITSLVLGNSLLEHHTWEFEIAVLGEIKATSALIFDTGVLFVVVGVIATLLEILGSEGDDPDGVTPEEATR